MNTWTNNTPHTPSPQEAGATQSWIRRAAPAPLEPAPCRQHPGAPERPAAAWPARPGQARRAPMRRQATFSATPAQPFVRSARRQAPTGHTRWHPTGHPTAGRGGGRASMARCPLNAPGRHPRAASPAVPGVTAQQTVKRQPRAALPGKSPALARVPGTGPHTQPPPGTQRAPAPIFPMSSTQCRAGPGGPRRHSASPGTGTGRRLRPSTPHRLRDYCIESDTLAIDHVKLLWDDQLLVQAQTGEKQHG